MKGHFNRKPRDTRDMARVRRLMWEAVLGAAYRAGTIVVILIVGWYRHCFL